MDYCMEIGRYTYDFLSQKKITADIQNLNIYIPLRLESEAGFECSAGVFVHWQGTFRNVAPSRSYGLTRMSVPPVIQ